MKDEIKKKILYYIAGLWLFFTMGLADWLTVSGLRLVWIIVISGSVGFADFLFFLYLYSVWGINKEDVKPVNPTVIPDLAISDYTSGAISFIPEEDPIEEVKGQIAEINDRIHALETQE